MRFIYDEIKKELADNWEQFADKNEQDAYDLLIEYADGFVPVYNHEIISDWAEMPSEFDDSWKDQIGDDILDRGIVSLMSIDLMTYYLEEATRAWKALLEEKERKEND